jgi:hypothetical protein
VEDDLFNRRGLPVHITGSMLAFLSSMDC